MADKNDNPCGELLAKVSFPLYTIKALSGQHILVAGGGGSAKTGVANGFQIFELTYSGRHTEAEEVAWHETGERAIMNCVTFSHGREEVLAAGLDDDLQLYQIKRKLVDESKDGGVLPDEEKFVQTRRRRKSESLSNSQEGRFFKKKRQESVNKRISFDITTQQSVRTDFNKGDDSFQKVVRVSLDRSFLVTGGCDGHLRIWKYPGLTKLRDLAAHAKEVDDIDISPSGSKIVSIGKDNKCHVWNVKDGKKAAALDFDPPQNGTTCKYMFKKCRFGIVEGDKQNFRLFTLHNASSTRQPSYIVKWNTTTYVPEKVVPFKGSLSALAVSDDGRFLAVGSMDTGSVSIYISYSLQLLKTVESAHHTFVTGLEFLPSGEAARAVTGDSDASVVSISVDNQVKIHHIPRRGTISVMAASLIIVVVMVLTFVICGMLGL